jgi:ankyrin repeat protein
LAAARVLLDAGADPNVADETQQSAYLISTSEVGDDPRLLDLMLASGAEVNAKDRFNGTGLIRAADRGFPLICQRLLDAGLDKDHINRLGWTALHEAIILGDGSRRYVETVRVLAEGGVDVTIPSQRDQVTPLQHAERRGYEQMVQILRRAGA